MRCAACDKKVQSGAKYMKKGERYCNECLDSIADEHYELTRRGIVLYGLPLKGEEPTVDKGWDDD